MRRQKKQLARPVAAMLLALACALALPLSTGRSGASAAGAQIGAPVNFAVTVTSQPESKTVMVGSTVTFTVTATGVSTYQWQYRNTASGTWASSSQSGNKTATLSVSATAGLHGFQFRCKMTDASGNVTYSEIATLSLRPRITTQPANKTAAAGSNATFTIAANGKADLSYQWQYRKDSSSSWANSGQSGNKTATLTVATTAALHGYQFRCRVTDGNGQISYSDAATLSVKPSITKQPANKTAAVGANVTFSVTATGNGLTYQWQVNKTGTWTNCTSTGSNTATFSFTAKASYSGWQYRCVVTDSTGSATSETAKLTVN